MKHYFFIVLIILGISPAFPQFIKPLTLESVVENCPDKKKIDSILVKEGFKFTKSLKQEDGIEYRYSKAKSKETKSQDISLSILSDGYCFLSLTSKDKKFLKYFSAELLKCGYILEGEAPQRTGNVIQSYGNLKYVIQLFQIVEQDNSNLYYLEIRSKSVN